MVLERICRVYFWANEESRVKVFKKTVNLYIVLVMDFDNN